MNATYTNRLDPCIQVNIKTEPLVTDQESIKDELASMPKDNPRAELLSLVPDLARKRTPEQLQQMREEAKKEVGPFSPMVEALVDLFFNAAISCTTELAKNENTAPGGNPEAVKSDRITHDQDDSISCSA
jgi:hypothetical protein